MATKLRKSNGTFLTLDQIKGYKSYVALLNQSDEDDPVPTILENTIGNIVWTRYTPGRYFGTLNGAFPANKTWVLPGTVDDWAGQNGVILKRTSNNVIEMNVVSDDSPNDGLLVNSPIEIRVYD